MTTKKQLETATKELLDDGTWTREVYDGGIETWVYCLPPVPVVSKILEGWLDLPVDSLGYVSVGRSTYANYADLGKILRELLPVVTGFGGYVYNDLLSDTFTCLMGYDSDKELTSLATKWVKPAVPSHVRVWSTNLAATKALLKIT